ncbi:hypothetical protein H6P81_011482 [Aristolochia fimbriata]|uniref:Uncharacterized protein n=1 Tax=Aristolochia fimbriata TaxID=158543 RepID=A0AAV7EV59_ARIFI|nr:hypothetical protein H6P81_011482 [Aristolochia fimbriata]
MLVSRSSVSNLKEISVAAILRHMDKKSITHADRGQSCALSRRRSLSDLRSVSVLRSCSRRSAAVLSISLKAVSSSVARSSSLMC